MLTVGEAQQQRERWRYVGLLVVFLALLVALGIQLILLVPTTHRATSAIALRPLTAEQSAESIEMQAHEYSVLLGAKQTAAEVLDELALSGSEPDVDVSATQDTATSTIRIEASAPSERVAVAVANGLASRAEQFGADDDTAKVVVVLEAGPAGVTSGPPRTLYVAALLALAALLLAGGLYRIRERTT